MGNLLKIKYLTCIYLFIILLGTVLPLNSGSSPLNDHYTLHIRWDYLLHVLVYVPLPLLLGLSLMKRSREQKQKFKAIRFWAQIVLLSLFITTLFECLQMVIPYRAFNINDLVANGVGAMLGLVGLLVCRKSVFHFISERL
ncbi:MAG: VanZ family protein [Bacteroidales bacterium]|nr:VanZ family protein [Bacteroidales bacterium]